jgi:hypothetical protein
MSNVAYETISKATGGRDVTIEVPASIVATLLDVAYPIYLSVGKKDEWIGLVGTLAIWAEETAKRVHPKTIETIPIERQG